MPIRTHDVEATLIELYNKQADRYGELLMRLTAARAKYTENSFPIDVMTEMEVLTAAASELNNQILQIKSRWEALRQPAGPRLTDAVSRVRGVLTSLVEQFSSAEEHVAKLRDKLSPEINAESRRTQMRNAYARVNH